MARTHRRRLLRRHRRRLAHLHSGLRPGESTLLTVDSRSPAAAGSASPLPPSPHPLPGLPGLRRCEQHSTAQQVCTHGGLREIPVDVDTGDRHEPLTATKTAQCCRSTPKHGAFNGRLPLDALLVQTFLDGERAAAARCCATMDFSLQHGRRALSWAWMALSSGATHATFILVWCRRRISMVFGQQPGTLTRCAVLCCTGVLGGQSEI
jgi:hypothetical protein